MNDIGTQEIKTERLLLRKFKKTDYKDMFKYVVKEEVAKYMSWTPHENIEETKALCEIWASEYNSRRYNWAIVYNNSVIGAVDVMKLIENSAFLGWLIDSAYWNQGIMTEAATAVRDYLFEKVQVDNMYAAHVTENIGSGRVMQKIGMKPVSCEEYYAACNEPPKQEFNGLSKSFYKMTKSDWMGTVSNI